MFPKLHNNRLLCNGFEPVGTFRFSDSNSPAWLAKGAFVLGRKACCLAVEGLGKLDRAA